MTDCTERQLPAAAQPAAGEGQEGMTKEGSAR